MEEGGILYAATDLSIYIINIWASVAIVSQVCDIELDCRTGESLATVFDSIRFISFEDYNIV